MEYHCLSRFLYHASLFSLLGWSRLGFLMLLEGLHSLVPLLNLEVVNVPNWAVALLGVVGEYFELSVLEEDYLWSIIESLVSLQNRSQYHINLKLICRQLTNRTEPSRIRRPCSEIEKILKIETLKMITEYSPCRYFQFLYRERAAKTNLDELAWNLVIPYLERFGQKLLWLWKCILPRDTQLSNQPLYFFLLDDVYAEEVGCWLDPLVSRLFGGEFLGYYQFVVLAVEAVVEVEGLIFAVFKTWLLVQRCELFYRHSS